MSNTTALKTAAFKTTASKPGRWSASAATRFVASPLERHHPAGHPARRPAQPPSPPRIVALGPAAAEPARRLPPRLWEEWFGLWN